MDRRSIRVLAAGLLFAAFAADTPTRAAEAPEPQDWSFGGVWGVFDAASRQRGLQVFREVCAGCHGLGFVAYRNLEAIGLDAETVKAIAAEYPLIDGPNEEGEMFERPAKPSDLWVPPFANDNAARASNNGALPPDLSLITKARKDGADYLFAMLTNYDEAACGDELPEGMYCNPSFPGAQIAMPQPLLEDGVEYADGTEASVEQMARDVTEFLVWAAEPELEARKRMGVKVMLFLIIFTAMLYAVKRKVWTDIH
jgi:ubiquinol-cytochrome c reductase cytochrome c1 subunit